MIEQHYSGQEVANLLGVHEETIRKLALRGEIRWVPVGGQRRFPESAITEYLEHGSSPARVVSLDRRRHTRGSAKGRSA